MLGVSKKYPSLTGERNKTIRYWNFLGSLLNSFIVVLNTRSLLLKFVNNKPETRICEVKVRKHLKPDVLKMVQFLKK